jgi:hypothetical protein
MERMSRGQIHQEDVRALYLMNPPDLEMRKLLVEHVAVRLWERTLWAKSAYWTVREEIPEFSDAIDEVLGAKKKEKTARKTPEAGGSHHHPKGGASRAQGENAEKEKEKTPKQKRGKTKTVTLRVEVVRRATNGRPARAKLDLGAIGISKEKFCGRR